MLDWQGKRWLKVLSIALIIAFLAYDISWATDFSPISLSSITPGFFPKITDFISTHIFKKTQEKDNSEETEISFRSQLIPTKKYEERSGFLRLESAKESIERQIDETQKRIEIERMRLQNKINTDYKMNKGLYMNAVEKAIGEQSITDQVMKSKADTINAASAGGEFSYQKYDDGMTIYFKDNLVDRIQDEKIIDPLGNVTLKNSYNFKYNEKRMMTDYEANVIDPQQDISHIKWSGGTYTPDSEFYATNETNANKNITNYVQEITDEFGNTTKLVFKDGEYSGKLSTSYIEESTDIFGNLKIDEFSNVKYDANRVFSYHLVTTDTFGNVTATDRVSTSYNDKNLVTDYNERISDLLANSLIKEWHGQYNDLSQLTGYTEKNKDESGNVVEVQGYSLGYDNFNRLVSYKTDTKDALGIVTKEEIWDTLDQHDRVINSNVISADGLNVATEQNSSYVYNNQYQITNSYAVIKEQIGFFTFKETAFTYDKYGRVEKIKDTYTQTIEDNNLISSQETVYTYYNSFSKVKSKSVKTTDASGVEKSSETTYEYNSFNLVSHASTIHTEHILSGDQVLIIETNEDVIYGYDQYKKLKVSTTKKIDAAGVETIDIVAYTYNLDTGYVDQLAATHIEYIEIDGSVKKVVSHEITAYTYDENGRISVQQVDRINPDGTQSKTETSYIYDNYSRIDTASVIYTSYSDSGDMIVKENVEYYYDEFNRLFKQAIDRTNADGTQSSSIVVNAFDQFSNIKTSSTHRINTDGTENYTTASYIYDEYGRISTQTITTTNSDATQKTNVITYIYDAFGRVIRATTITRNPDGTNNTNVVTYTYDAFGRVNSQTSILT
nr:RHS repeat protein [Candidatus Omnitrophota bacterium]